MRVLVTNDDGVEAPGIRVLAEAVAAAGHEVVVVAPSGERSGSGAAIGRLHRSGPIACTTTEWDSLPGVAVHGVDLPPAAAVYAGLLGAFGPRPDVVASGINPGLNYGHLVLHSGTVGAGLTAAAVGVPAVAVSLAWSATPHWATAAAFVPAALDWVADGPPRVVNLNIPDRTIDQVAGVRTGSLLPFTERWEVGTGPGELLMRYVEREDHPDPDTDLAAALDGHVSITVLEGVATGEADGAVAAVRAAYERSKR